MDTARTADRRARLRARVIDRELDALLVTELLDVRYLTGFTGSNAALLLAADPADDVLCTDGRYRVQVAAEAPDLPVIIERASDLALAARFAPGQLGFESQAVTVDGLAALTAAVPAGVHLVAVSGLVQTLRVIKDDDEIAALRAACEIGDRALAELIAAGGIRPGRTERELALDLDGRMRALGATDIAFPTIAAAGENSAIPHHQPTARELAAGDLVKLDFGAIVAGYHSDMTRTLVLGPPAQWQRELHALVAQAAAAGRVAVRAGRTGREIDRAARDVIVAAGQGENFGHGLGHGVGLQIHEAPSLAATAPPPPAGIIEPNMTVTVEPGVYLPGRGGVRIEDCGVVGPDGFEPLTFSPRELVELPV